MLIFESEGYIEAEAKDIVHLSRSVATVCFGDSEQAGFNLSAVLCEFNDDSQKRCQVAFHSKVLKRALVFSVKNPNNISALQNAEDILSEMGFTLEKVNLKLSPAMQEVVLRDVSGVASPDIARKYRTERSLLLSELQKDINRGPDSDFGKRAALKLATEVRLDERAEELQQILSTLLSPREVGDGYSALMEQLKDLTERMEKSEKLLDDERKQREFSETITAAAEKRIQELEEILVDVETKSANETKQKRKVVQLQGKVKDLEAQLQERLEELKIEKYNQQQFIEDVKSANEQIAGLEEKLQKSEMSLNQTLDKIAEDEADNEQLTEEANQSEKRIIDLEKELKSAKKDLDKSLDRLAAHEKSNLQLTESVESADKRIAELEKELKEAPALEHMEEERNHYKQERDVAQQEKETITEQLAKAELEIETLTKAVSKSQGSRNQNEVDGVQLEKLQEELERESSIRRRLERGAVDDEKQIKELQAALEQTKSIERSEDVSSDSELIDKKQLEINDLKHQLQESKALQEDFEHELDQAHKMIDSLEKMVRESSQGTILNDEQSAVDAQKVLKLEAKLELLNEQLEQERAKQGGLSDAVSESSQKHVSSEADKERKPLRKSLKQAPEPQVEKNLEVKKPSKPSKPLPHEIRPKPPKGVFFVPDWDMEGLPCKDKEQVVRVWETVFNVQISLDGYPSQYCMAYLVVLKVSKVKKLFMLFQLKQSKHILVKVPAKVPKNEKDLKNAIENGLKYLKTSGFEMEEMPEEYVESTLSGFFLE